MGTGRPSDIFSVWGTRDDGSEITVPDKIIESLRVGAYFETAVSAAGIAKDTAYGWLRTAGKLRIKSGGDLETLTPPPNALEAACIAFSDSVAEADAEWELRILTDLERLGKGDIEVTRTTIKNLANGDIEETVTTERTLPDTKVLLWRLERKHPDRYGRRVEVTGAGGEPLIPADERVATILETLKQRSAEKAAKRKGKAK